LPKSDLKTICNAAVEGALSLGGCTVFFSKLFGTATSPFTTFTPLVPGISIPGLLFSLPFSVMAGYGAYKCHDEVGLSNQPLEKMRILDTVASEANIAEQTILADEEDPENDDALHSKTKDELINIIRDLRALVAEQKAQLVDEEIEKKAAQSTPLKFKQRLGIAGEYIAHSAGFTGDVLGLIALFGSIPYLEAELVLQGCCLIIGYISAMGEVRTAEESMRLNNMRANLLKHHSLFKQQTAEKGKIEIRIDSATASPRSADSESSEPYNKLADTGVMHPHPLSPASSLSRATL
jgi:hypothetical protein